MVNKKRQLMRGETGKNTSFLMHAYVKYVYIVGRIYSVNNIELTIQITVTIPE